MKGFIEVNLTGGGKMLIAISSISCVEELIDGTTITLKEFNADRTQIIFQTTSSYVDVKSKISTGSE